ncbi:protein SRC2 homolog [Fagus crenata]
MGCKRLDIDTISAKDLKDVNHFSKMGVYAILSIQSDKNNGNNSLEHRTTYDENGGKNPEWLLAPPKMFTFNVFTAPGLTLVIKLKTKGSFHEKDVGEARVPIMYLMENYGDAKDEKRMSFGVTTPGGKAKGVLEFSFKLVDVTTYPPGHVASVASYPSGHVAAPPLFQTGGVGVGGAYQHAPTPGYGPYQYHAAGVWNPQAGYGYTPPPPPPPRQNSFIPGMLPAVADGAVMGLVKGSASALIDAIVNGYNN